MKDNSSHICGPTDRLDSVSRIILFCLTLVLVLFFSIHKIENRDLGWLLKNGQYIYETHRVPRVDTYSFTIPGKKYIDSQWLFQLILYISYRLLGLTGLTLLMAGILLATFSTVYFIGYDKKKYVITPVLMIAAIVMASDRFLVRPQLITLLLLSVYFFILEKHRKRGGRMIFLLPLIQPLWVNMHGLYVLGLVVPIIYLSAGLIDWKLKLPWRWNEEGGLRGKRWWWLALVLLVMGCESVLNPYTFDLALYPLTLFREIHSGVSAVGASVSEHMPPLAGASLNRSQTYFKWMIYLCTLCFLLNLKRLNLTHALLFGAFLYLALNARRNLDIFAIIAIPVTVVNVGGFMDYVSERFDFSRAMRLLVRAQIVATPLIAAGMIYMMFLIATDRYYIDDRSPRQFGFGISERSYPIKAANFIGAMDLPGNMFNDPTDGAYLIWRFYPERKVCFDLRTELYGEEFMANFKRIGSDPGFFERYADAMDIRYVVLHYDVGYLPESLIRSLIDSPLWKPVYFDEISVVFVRNIPENAQVIHTFGIDFATFESKKEEFDAALPADIGESHLARAHGTLSRLTDRIPRLNFPFAEVTRADFYKSLGYYDNARLLYERALEVYPDSTIAHSGLGTVYWKLKLYPFALAEFEAVRKLNPRSAANLMNLGNMYLVTGQIDEAAECFRKAKKLDPDKYLASVQLGMIYARQGRYEMAARELRQALKLNPDLQDVRELLREVEQRSHTGGQ